MPALSTPSRSEAGHTSSWVWNTSSLQGCETWSLSSLHMGPATNSVKRTEKREPSRLASNIAAFTCEWVQAWRPSAEFQMSHTPEAGQHGDGILRVLVCAQLARIVRTGGSCEVKVLGVSSLRGVRVWLRCCNKLAPSGRFLLMFSPWSILKAANSALHSSVSVLPARTRLCQEATQVRTSCEAENK